MREVFEREGATAVGVDVAGEDCLHHDLGSEDGNRRMVEQVVELHGSWTCWC